MNISQLASSDNITQLVLARALQYSKVLGKVEFYTKPGDAVNNRKEQGFLQSQTREIDKAYDPITTKPEYFPTFRKVLGATVRLDVARELLGYDISSEMVSQLLREAIGIGHGFDNIFINGISKDAEGKDTKEFNGLKVLCPDSQKISFATNGAIIQLGNQGNSKSTQQNFLEKLDETIFKCIGINKMIISNGAVLSRLNSVAREYIQWTTDSFGKKIASYNGVPLINIEEGGANVMPFNETCGTANTCSSIYVVSLEEQAGLSFLSVPQGFKVYPMQKNANFYEHMIDVIVDSALFRDKAISKLEGIMLG